MSLLIKNGEIITGDTRYRADIYCEDETISRIGTNLEVPPDTEVIDASGKYVFPGFIDPHVHIYLPFMGTFSKDTHETGSRAALVGGTTTYIEMVAPSRGEDPLEGYELWKSKAEGTSACDYSFHMGVSRFDRNTEAQLKEIIAQGITSFKVFLAYKGFFGIDDEELFHTLSLAQREGVIVAAHCENAELVAQLQQSLLAQGKTGPEFHEPSRPPTVEADGVHHFATFLETTGAHGYIVHLSCEAALEAALAAKSRGIDLGIEAVIPHLMLDKSYAERPNFEGAKYVMSPPLRERKNQGVLWKALQHGLIDTVATDHAPFDFTQKEMGRGDFTKIPNGIPAIEDRVNLLYTYGVNRGPLDIHRFVDAAATRAAKLFGLFPRKGTIQLGSDADLVVYDPNYRGTLSAASQHMNLDYNGFEGMEIDGRPSVVTVRGQVAVRDGAFVGEKGRGKLLLREPLDGAGLR
ncbi:MAG: dihydropyrimidinase [Trueperaceae bacterium]|nr:MAG: dihydropyrimidinase [Trueperaceae bacterium]